NGRVYFGADNNIKLQYGGLKNRGTWKDPFLSQNQGAGGAGVLCAPFYHCDSDTTENKARPMILNYTNKTEGGVGVVASDLIDIYKKIDYTGGSTTGMRAVPSAPTPDCSVEFDYNAPATDGKLHGETVAGYGLYIKTLGDKKNWAINPFTDLGTCGPIPLGDNCGSAFLHQVSRVTFHDDARFRAQNSKVYVGSPVLEVFGNLELNTAYTGSTSNQSLHIQTDSLILHDSLIISGDKHRLTTWTSNLERNMPVIKLGHNRFKPPYTEDAGVCAPCIDHKRNGALDTLVIKYENNAYLERLNSLIVDHTVLTFTTDSFDHSLGKPLENANIYTDILKIRNQVEFWTSADKTRDGHLELVSEIQMNTKSYAGIYTRHLHMEPIAPDCSGFNYSELWTKNNVVDVNTSATLGGFGKIHGDVYVENQAFLAPGYASLGTKGNYYEQKAGTLSMNLLSMDDGAVIKYSIGNISGLDGEKTDIVEVDRLKLRGSVYIEVEKRCNEIYEPGCYPIILYNTVDNFELNHLKLGTQRIDGHQLALDVSSTPGVVYLCVGDRALPVIQREVLLREPPKGVSMFPPAGTHYVPWGSHFTFTLTFTDYIYEVYTSREINGDVFEVLTGVPNENGEYVYTLRTVKTQPIFIYIGPKVLGPVANESIDKAAVYSFGNTLYIRVAAEDIATIYSITGALVKRINVPEGGTSQPLEKGAYIVTLKDGSVHKVMVR
ncbi:MAG: hypothetical protein LBE79_08575, partial [Tannerella sp.]|nr:hypothetical protein [Tannerella sp.]